MVTTSAISPYVTTYTTATPYITEAEFLAAPTALEVTDLIPNGTQAQQDRAITDSILRASSWADSLVRQVLAATVDIERGRYRIDRNGYVRVPLKFNPVLEVRAVSIGYRPSQMVALGDFSDVVVNRYSVEVPVWAMTPPTLVAPPGGFSTGSQVLVDTTYVNGWVNTLSSAAAAAAATTIPVVNPLGIYPGSSLVISDGPKTESVTVASTYTTGATSVPLTAGLANQHDAGVSVNNLPARVKEAVILLTTVVIQTRGNDAIILDALESPARMSAAYGASGESVAIAMEMLETLTRVW